MLAGHEGCKPIVRDVVGRRNRAGGIGGTTFSSPDRSRRWVVGARALDQRFISRAKDEPPRRFLSAYLPSWPRADPTGSSDSMLNGRGRCIAKIDEKGSRVPRGAFGR